MPILDRFGEPILYCAAPGCRNRATVYPIVVIPPQGYPLSRGVKAVVSLILCRKHGREEKAETFLTDQFRAMASATTGGSPVPLDFDRAEIRLGIVGDKRWQEFQGQAGQARRGRESVH